MPLDYKSRYRLKPDNKQLEIFFERTRCPLSAIDRALDENVQRFIAQRAGLRTNSDPGHKDCQANTKTGKSRGIHNAAWDLQQIQIPSCMTHLEKMQSEHDFGVLSAKTRDAIHEQVQALETNGIWLNTGSLTQKVLRSSKAWTKLAEMGISVRWELRPAGFDTHTGEQIRIPLLLVLEDIRKTL